MSLPSTESFLKLLNASGVADEATLAKATELATESPDAKEFAVKLIRDGILTSWQAKFLLTGRHRLKIGKYTLHQRLDRAVFGDRFLAVHQQLNRKVELQLLPADLSSDQSVLEKFLTQAQQAAELDHPNLIHVFDIDQESGRYYLVIEHADGKSFEDDGLVKSLKLTEIGMYLDQISGAIQYVHDNDVVHGQINPSNLLLTEEKEIKVRNVAMATLIRQMESKTNQVLSISDSAVDDWIAFGKTGIDMIQKANVDVSDDERRGLQSILNGFIKVRENDKDQLKNLKTRLDQWVTKNYVVTNDSGETHGLGANLFSENAGPAPGAVDNESSSSPANEKSSDEQSPQHKSKTPIIVGAGLAFVVLIAIGLGAAGYLIYFKNDDVGAPDNDNVTVIPKSKIKTDYDPDLPTNKIDKKAIDSFNAKKLDGKKPQGKSPDQVQPEQNPPRKNDNSTNIKTKTSNNDKKNEPLDPFVIPSKNDPIRTNDLDKVKADPGDKSKTGDQTKPADKAAANDTAKKPDRLPPPFSKFAGQVELPKIDEAPQEKLLGQIFADKKHLLGLQLLTQPFVSPRNVTYELSRSDAENNQRWTVSIKRRAKSIEIAQFWLDGNDFKFQWSDQAAKERQAGFIKNCVLRLETRGETRFLKLRKPVNIGSLAVEPGTTETKKQLDLDYLPAPAAINFEVVLPSDAEIAAHTKIYFEPKTRRAQSVTKPIYLFPTDIVDARVYWIRLDLDLGRKSAVESRLQSPISLQDLRPRSFNSKHVERLLQSALQFDALLNQNLQKLQNYKPKTKKTEHSRDVSQASRLLELANKRTNEIKRILPLADKMFGFPIRVRIFFEIEGHQVDLATFDGQPVVYK